jgi:hypothetical protein
VAPFLFIWVYLGVGGVLREIGIWRGNLFKKINIPKGFLREEAVTQGD